MAEHPKRRAGALGDRLGISPRTLTPLSFGALGSGTVSDCRADGGRPDVLKGAGRLVAYAAAKAALLGGREGRVSS